MFGLAWRSITIEACVFCPTGSAAFDFWGGNRIGQNLYANCLLALDVRTGTQNLAFPIRPS